MFHSPRVEIFLDEPSLNGSYPPYIVEYKVKIQKIKESEPFKRSIPGKEYHLKQFSSKDARDKFAQLLGESLKQRLRLKPI